MTVSMVQSVMGDDAPEPVSPGAIIKAIKGDKYRRKVQDIRRVYQETLTTTNGDHKKAKRAVEAMKKKLPCVMWSGAFSARGDENVAEYSGLVCADVDYMELTPELHQKLRVDKHVCTAFDSPTGSGFKVVVKVGGDASQHKTGNFPAVKKYLSDTYGLEVDESGKNIERLCFASWDERAFCNSEAQLVPLPPAQSPPKVDKPVASTIVDLSQRQRIAEKLLGPIDWKDGGEGFCQCLGAHLHTSGNGARDCKVMIGGGAPTVFCFHGSCHGIVEAVNHQLRSQIGKAECNKNITNGRGGPVSTSDDPTEFDYANMLADVLPPIKTCGNVWHAYQNGAWGEIDRATLRPQAQEILPPVIRTARREATLLDHLEGRFQTSRESFSGFYKFTEAGDTVLNVSNGVVRVATNGDIVLEGHSDKHLFTQKLAAKYDPQAECPLFNRVLGEAVPDIEDQVLFQLCAGNFLLPDCRFEVALVNYGDAGRGKSTLAEPIAAALGRANVSRLTMSQICDPKSYHVPKLRFAAVNLGTELDAVELGESAPFKTIVSGEPIEARPIYGTPFTMVTSCKLWFLANCLPRFKHGTEAELRRTRFIGFDYLPPKKDVTLKTRLAQERDGVFRWMLAGLVELLNCQTIPLGGEHSRRVHERFKVSNDPVGTFVSTCCHLDPATKIPKDSLNAEYREFCERHDLPPILGTWFFRSLYERWTALREVRIGDDRRRFVSGICLKAQ